MDYKYERQLLQFRSQNRALPLESGEKFAGEISENSSGVKTRKAYTTSVLAIVHIDEAIQDHKILATIIDVRLA